MHMINLFTSSRKATFTRQLKPHLQNLYRQAYRFSGNQDDAEDLVQELLTRLYEKNIDLNAYEKPASWLLRALYNQFIDQCRKKNRLPVDNSATDSDEILESISNIEDSPHTLHELQNTKKTLDDALLSLNPEQRALIALHDIEGHSLPELSEITGIPLGTLKSRLHRSRQSLREILQPELTIVEPFPETLRVT